MFTTDQIPVNISNEGDCVDQLQEPNKKLAPPTFPNLLKLSTQLAAFKNTQQFIEFFNNLFTHPSFDDVNFRELSFRWFYNSMDILDSRQFEKATAIAEKINKETSTKPVALEVFKENKQVPKKAHTKRKITIFDIPEDLMSDIYTYFRLQELSISVKRFPQCSPFAWRYTARR